jgi:hypothetical protein
MVAHAFSLEILGYDMHSLLDIIKYFRHIKDYGEDISPIVIANHRNEMEDFIKTESFIPGLLLVSFSNSIFRKHSLHKVFILKYTMHIISSYHREIFYNICMATSTFSDTTLGTSEINALILTT